MFDSFMVGTWIAATAVALAAGTIGFFVVLRGAAFEAHSLPLGAFPGAAASALLGVSQYAGLLVFSVLGVVGMGWGARRDRHHVATALVLVLLLGLGALFLSQTSEYAPAILSLLFGEVLGVDRASLPPVIALSAFAVLGACLLYRPLVLNAVSAELGAVRGLRAHWLEALFLLDLALATATALPVVGALLVFSLIVGPPSAARMIASGPLRALLLSVALALATVWLSIALAYETNWPVGFFIGMSSALSYGAGRAWRASRGRASRWRHSAWRAPPARMA